jgi:hypothetical protein
MKLLKQSIACFVAVFVISGAVLAGTANITGTAYVTLNMEMSVTADGHNLQEYTNTGVWVQDGMPEGFPSKMVAECKGTTVYSAEWANLGDTFICKATDIDGDGFVNVGGASNPDFSDCHAETVAGWGKYAGSTQTVQCAFVENITQNTFILKWTGEFTTP